MSRIGLNISVSGLTGFLIIRWVKASAPLAEVGRSAAFTYPYDAVYNITDLEPVVYTVQLYRSVDGTALTQLIKDWSIDASKVNLTTISTYQYKVGRGNSSVTVGAAWADPDDGDTILNDERLDGALKADMVVHEAGFGNKLDAEYNLVSGGGIELLDGKTFVQDTAWFITVAITQEGELELPAGTSSTKYDTVQVITEDQDFDDGDTPLENALVICNSENNVLTVTFPDLTLIADHTHVTFNTHNGTQKYLKLQFDAGDNVRFCNLDKNVIYLAKCEKISLYFFDGACYVTDYEGNAQRRGSLFIDYDAGRAADNTAMLLADESTGELLQADYPGLYEQVAGMPSGTVALGTGVGQWSYDSGGGVYPNKRFFGIQTGSPQKVRVPHLTGMVVKFGGTPGTYEADGVGPLSLEIRDGSGGSSTGTIVNTGFSGQDNPGSWVANGAAGAEKYIRNTGASETTVKSFKQVPYILL